MSSEQPAFELFVNYACQARCGFCYNPEVTPELLRRELGFEQAAARLYRAARSGARRLNVHGGEPTLRDDLTKLVRLARKLGFEAVTVVSNGVRLGDGRYARALAAAGVTHVRLSAHGPDAALHDAIVGVPGAFERLARAGRHLRRLGVAVGLNVVLVRDNAARLAETVERFLLAEGFAEAIVYFPHERGLMAENAARLSLPYAEARGPLRRAAERLERAGRRGDLAIANVPPCAAPELADLLLDWERSGGEEASTMLHPEGHATDLDAMKDGQRRAVAACASCGLAGRCRGIEAEYLRRWGEEGLLPRPALAGAGA